jgi:cytochrome c biogenesis protein CcmG/thiol:disulfide interchange protein DsbE
MPNFTMTDLQGLPWSLSAHRGRVVLVNFWATWCPPCREEIPGFVRLAKRARDLDIAGIAMDDGDSAGVRQFVKAAGVPYPVLFPSAPIAAGGCDSESANHVFGGQTRQDRTRVLRRR